MGFDVDRFACELIGQPSAADVLRVACTSAAAVSQGPAFAAHLLPGRAWETAKLASVPSAAPLGQSVRSALYAAFRRVAAGRRLVRLTRQPDSEPIFHALSMTQAELELRPLLNRGSQLLGVLVTPTGPQSALDSIGTITGAGLEACYRYEQTRRNHERLQLFSETSANTLWDWDIEAGEIWWGGHLDRLFDASSQVWKRTTWRRDRIHPNDADRVLQSFSVAMEGGAPSWEAEYQLTTSRDRTTTVRERAYFLRDAQGRAYRAIGVLSDVSELRRLLVSEQHAREQAERALLVKDQFLATLGHELRNPLAPIRTVLELMERRGGIPARELGVLRRQADQLIRLVDDLLDLARISSGKLELTKEIHTADTLIERAVETARPIIDQRRHELSIEVDSTLSLEVDGPRLIQVLSNLLTNAAKYTEPGGRIALLAVAEGREIAIRVRDNGIGIAPEFLPTLFEMFTQDRQAADRAQTGLGLGLSIALNIVRLHGGSLTVESQGIGRGSEFTLRLPLSSRPASPMNGQSRKSVAPIESLNLLIVDDNRDAADSMSALLEITGHCVQVANTADDAIAMFAKQHFDVAVLDIGLPDIDGYELARRLRGAVPSLRLIALTGYGTAEDKAKADDAGFDAHLVKPVEPEALERLIESLEPTSTLQQRHSRRARPTN